MDSKNANKHQQRRNKRKRPSINDDKSDRRLDENSSPRADETQGDALKRPRYHDRTRSDDSHDGNDDIIHDNHDATSDHAIRDSRAKQRGGDFCNGGGRVVTVLNAANIDYGCAESFHENFHNPHFQQRHRQLTSLLTTNGTSSAPRNHERLIIQRNRRDAQSTQALAQCAHSPPLEIGHAIRTFTSNCHEERTSNDNSEKTSSPYNNDIHYGITSQRQTGCAQRWKTSIFLSTTLAFGIFLSIFPILSVTYTLYFENTLFLLERTERDKQINEKYKAILQHRETITSQLERHFQSAQIKLKQSQQRVVDLRIELKEAREIQNLRMNECRTVVEEHQHLLKEKQDRLAALRGEKQHAGLALDMAWLRIDEMMEENHDLSNQLKQSMKERKILSLQLQTKDASEARKLQKEKEQLYELESLTEKYQMAEEEKEQLQEQLQHYREEITSISDNHDYLEFTCSQTMNSFFAPILQYVQKLQRTSERQHSLILELTSLIHSLQTSFELQRAHAETQSLESIHAVSAVASAANEIARAKEEKYILERDNYMEYMEGRLNRLEEEALGAVQAVAEAAGKLEFERKREEEGRWKGYVEEVERVLGEIGVGAEEELVRGGSIDGEESSDVGIVGNENLGIVETPVLLAAISRRVEIGIDSLRQFIRPYDYYFGSFDESHYE